MSDIVLKVTANLDNNHGVTYTHASRASYAIKEMAFHFNQTEDSFEWEVLNEEQVLISVPTSRAQIIYMLEAAKEEEPQARLQEAVKKARISFEWEQVEDFFYHKGMLYMLCGYCPVKDKHYLNKTAL